ncbi:hypothetical protein NKH77_00420 [Streptomyces sp. M19]
MDKARGVVGTAASVVGSVTGSVSGEAASTGVAGAAYRDDTLDERWAGADHRAGDEQRAGVVTVLASDDAMAVKSVGASFCPRSREPGPAGAVDGAGDHCRSRVERWYRVASCRRAADHLRP